MKAAKALMMGLGTSGGAVPGGGLYVDDVFSAYARRGTSNAATVVTGQDLATYGGVVHSKGRSGTYGATDHYLFHTDRGADIFLSTNTTAGQGAFTAGTSVTSFNSNGFELGVSPYVNDSGTEFVEWVFRNAPRFYGHQVVTKLSGSNRIINFPELVTLGMVRVKLISGISPWYVWHKALPDDGSLLVGNDNLPVQPGNIFSVTGTTVTISESAGNGQYLVEAWAHDESPDGIVQCGSFATDGSSNALVDLGWEPQYLFVKIIDAVDNWFIYDQLRGLPVDAAASTLYPNLSNAEGTPPHYISCKATGFSVRSYTTGSKNYIYLAIRRSNKPPTSGTQVYNAIARTGTGVATTIAGVGFAPDLAISRNRLSPSNEPPSWYDRVRGATFQMTSNSNGVEIPRPDTLTGFDVMDGVRVGSDTEWVVNKLGSTYINHYFRRAPGFMDVTPDTGTGSAHTIQHNLAAVPQLMIRKARGVTTDWQVWQSALAANEYLTLNSDAAKAISSTVWNNTLPTSSVFSVGTNANTNTFNVNYVTYLFSTLAGISKVGSYTGNGSTQTIPCGFSTGSRFVLVKRIDNAGDWFVWDTARGITPTTDPHLSLNIPAAEVTTDDSIDQYSTGFIVKQNSATNINVLGASYLFLAIS